MTTKFHSDIALLAPVPLVHLEDGQPVCVERGKVAYGSRRWELFRELDALRGDLPVHTFIYASHTDGIPDPVASWHAFYVGHVYSEGGAHPLGGAIRPPSAMLHPADRSGHWAVFWEVTGLERLTPHPIAQLRGYRAKHDYGRGFVPEGPILIHHP